MSMNRFSGCCASNSARSRWPLEAGNGFGSDGFHGLPLLGSGFHDLLQVALDLADRHYVLSKGAVCYTGTSAELEHNDHVLSEYLSV